ncbi:MAG: hypothetical protein ACREM1_04745, partial [Longimicrobiales bacterium]
MKVPVRVVFAFLGVLVLGGCRSEQPVGPMPREAFIDVMVELRRAASQDLTQEEFGARKAEILTEANVTDSVLVEYARVYGGQLEHMAEVWDSVNARLRVVEDSA